MRYTEQELEELKRINPIEDIFREHGYELIKRGSHLATLCRFHPDKNPSLIITPENNLWNCLGCSSYNGNSKTGGDVFNFLMKERNISFIGAVEYLKGRNGNESSSLAAEKKPATKERKSLSINLQKLLNRVIEFYQHIFTEDKQGYNYMVKERNITNPAIFETFRIGFCNNTLFRAIPEQGEVVEGLKELGIITKSGQELFKDCVVFPITDRNGNIIHIYGRKIQDEPVRHLYLPGNHKGVFNQHILKSYDEIILTESIIDSLSLYQAGFKNTIPCYGVNGLTEDHIKAFKENNTRNIIILFDGDETGKRAGIQLKEKMESISFSCRIVAIPDNEDPNSYLKKYSPEELEQLIYGAAKREKTITESKPKQIEDGFILQYCQRSYIIRGIEGNPNRLRANIRAENCRKFHIDTVDLYSARARKLFIQDAINLFKEEQEIIEQDMDRIIEAVEDYIAAKSNNNEQPVKVMTDEEKKEALRLGRSKNLVQEITKDIEKCGYIGEDMNKLICYLAMTSRKMEEPLSVLVISGSGAGKTSLQDTVLNLCPEEDLVKLTSLTGRALFYKKEYSLSHKVLAIEEEKGAEEAGYAIRNLITAKKLSIEATIKDIYTGKMTTMENTVKGPTSVFKTTTNPETDPETKTRFIVISIDESREQTKRILDYQRYTYTIEGYFNKQERDKIIQKHRNFQRLLRPIAVFNPYSKLLTYLDDRLLVRRENPKYMNIINTVAFIHQLQRPIKTINQTEYIEVTLEDIETANEIAHNILGKSLDELASPSKNLLELIYQMVKEKEKQTGISRNETEFTRREVREYTKWSDYQIKIHIKQLEDLEYLIFLVANRGRRFCYKLAYNGEGQDGNKFVLGLINIEQLKEKMRLVPPNYNGISRCRCASIG